MSSALTTSKDAPDAERFLTAQLIAPPPLNSIAPVFKTLWRGAARLSLMLGRALLLLIEVKLGLLSGRIFDQLIDSINRWLIRVGGHQSPVLL